MSSPARRALIALSIIAALVFALAAAYAISDQDAKKRANTMEASLSLSCTQDWDGDIDECNAWAAGVVADFPDLAQSCNSDTFTYTTKTWCVTRDENVPEMPLE